MSDAEQILYITFTAYIYLRSVAYPGILFGGGSTNSVEDRQNGDFISFHFI